MRTRQLLASAAVLAAVFCLTLQWRPTPEPAPVVKRDSNPFAFVKSMQGTEPDGKLNLSGDTLVADAELRHLFDYYLGAIGEKTLPQIRAEIELQLTHQLPAAALPAARDLLTRYIAYKTALVDLEKAQQQQQSADANPMRARLIAMRQVRERYFSPKEIAGMWGFDDTYDDDAVARWEIMQDTKLTPDEKRAKLAAQDAKMPPELRKEREAPHVVAKEEDKARQMRAAGASEDDIYRMRAATFSPEAAARMAAVDQENAGWKSRIADYLDARGQVLNNASLSDADKEIAVQQLRDAKFSANEQKRLGAYE